MTLAPIAYVTDVEGQWDRLAGFLARTAGVRLVGDRLELAEGWIFVFGGDAIDRGPASRRLVRLLVDAKERYGDRVVLIAGNRDLNKMRLVRELAGFPPTRAPEAVRGDRVQLLKFILANTMGAADAFAHRATELGTANDADVVDSFLEDLAPNGDLARYLAGCQLAFRHGPTLFLHGGLTTESLGHVPGQSFNYPVAEWVDALNAWCRAQVGAFLARTPADLAQPPWAPILAYQAPAPGKPLNPSSVVYGRLSDALNNPALPTREVVETLENSGIRRLVLGHTPSGDTPAVLRGGDFELVIADNSRGRVATGAGVTIDGAVLETSGAAQLDDGEQVEVAHRFELGKRAGPLGTRVSANGRLVKGRTADGRLVLYRGLPGHVLEQVATTDEALAGEALEEPWPRAGHDAAT